MEVEGVEDMDLAVVAEEFNSSGLTAQEASALAHLHINTVRKILKGEKVHPNSVTKFRRALSNTGGASYSSVVAFPGTGGDPSRSKTRSLHEEFEQISAELNAFIDAYKDKPRLLKRFDIHGLFVEYDRIGGLLAAISAAKERHKKRH